MQMTEADIKAYARTWEQGTLTTMEGWSETDSLYRTFYGRNGAAAPVPGTCSAQHNPGEQWGPSGYGSTAAILDMAKRWGSAKMLAWLGRNFVKTVEWCEWWLDTFGKPPGENAHPFDICGITKTDILTLYTSQNRHGDTDIKRHWNSAGIHWASVDPEVMALGSWSYSDAVTFADMMYDWIIARTAELFEAPKQYLRYGNDLDTLCGIISVYRAAGESTKEATAYATLYAFFLIIFADDKRVVHEGADGTEWVDWNYGHMIQNTDTGEYYRPFRYGFYPFGHQAWYRGHLLVALAHMRDHAVYYADTTFQALIEDRILKISRWMDPTERINAPLAPITNTCVSFLHNSNLAGGFTDPARYYLLENLTENTLAEWAAVGESSNFNRFCAFDSGTGVWKSDGGYWETDYVDLGGVAHAREHTSGGSLVPRLPGAETANWYACLDGLWVRANLLNDSTLKQFVRIMAFQYLGFCHLSDVTIRLSKRLTAGITQGLNNVGRPSRSWHWAIQAGWMWRSDEVTV